MITGRRSPAQAAAWLELAGCKKIFYTSAYTGEGIADILSYLKEERDTLPWEEVKSKYDELALVQVKMRKIKIDFTIYKKGGLFAKIVL